MDEKKVRETIAWLETKRKIHKYGAYTSPIILKEQIDMIEERYDLAIEALEKQLPKKPKEEKNDYTFKLGEFRVGKCPNCLSEASDWFDICIDCGQKLDWTVEE